MDSIHRHPAYMYIATWMKRLVTFNDLINKKLALLDVVLVFILQDNALIAYERAEWHAILRSIRKLNGRPMGKDEKWSSIDSNCARQMVRNGI